MGMVCALSWQQDDPELVVNSVFPVGRRYRIRLAMDTYLVISVSVELLEAARESRRSGGRGGRWRRAAKAKIAALKRQTVGA